MNNVWMYNRSKNREQMLSIHKNTLHSIKSHWVSSFICWAHQFLCISLIRESVVSNVQRSRKLASNMKCWSLFHKLIKFSENLLKLHVNWCQQLLIKPQYEVLETICLTMIENLNPWVLCDRLGEQAFLLVVHLFFPSSIWKLQQRPRSNIPGGPLRGDGLHHSQT